MDIGKQTEKQIERAKYALSAKHKNWMTALEITKKFIIKHKLILKGGMAIDFALKQRGDSIYDDDEIPDYDFYSDQHAKHAYMLAKELCAKKYDDVNVINAYHVTTIKVRLGGDEVADITYIPTAMFKKLQTINYGSLVVLHPEYSIMDQFSSISNYLDGPPREVIFHRMEKDRVRLLLLLKYFAPSLDTKQTEKQNTKNIQLIIPFIKNTVITGWPALAYYNSIAHLDKKYNTKFKSSATAITVDTPSSKVVFKTDDWESVVPLIKKYYKVKQKPKFYHKILDFPRKVTMSDKYTIYDTLGRQFTIVYGAKHKKYLYPSLTTLAWYFMHVKLFYPAEAKLANIAMVNILELMATNKWKVDSNMYGSKLWGESDVFTIRKLTENMYSHKPQHMYDCEATPKMFDPSDSDFFYIDGSEAEKTFVKELDSSFHDIVVLK